MLTRKYLCATCASYHYAGLYKARMFSTSSPPPSHKDSSGSLGKVHNPADVERGWMECWEQQKLFQPHSKADADKVFSMLLPPPNVTGTLHLGHALTGAIQDAIVRWHRMKGYQTLWVPGTDHAGIATHSVVERRLWRRHKKTRHDLGRDRFIQEVWDWKAEHGDIINQQLRTLGLSLDWSRQYFTMNKNLNEAVTEAFCRLYDRGLIYQAERMINWSCALQSSLSDIEVDNVKLDKPTFLRVPGETDKVEFGLLSSFAYPVENSGESVVVATTRLETMLADTAVAVHPDDPRYGHLVGRRLQHPIDTGRKLPIIADSFVDMSFGTGAVKITPGHDHTDHEVGRRHDLPTLQLLQDDGVLLPDLPLVGGLTRFAARKKLKEALRLQGLYHGERPHPTVLPLCSRSGDVVEPRLKKQWFLSCKDMALRAAQAVESGDLVLMPEHSKKVWQEWLNNAQDWCLSRQLWWGHRIPVYTCSTTGTSVCAHSLQEAAERLTAGTGVDASKMKITQDTDVLDTWFSSSLLPFSTMGWPDKTEDLARFFPQELLETGQDILFFWVARMVMLSLELTDQLPFRKVLLHGLLRDAHGRKMSKSLGNVIDPVDVIRGISLEDLHKRLEEGNLEPSEVEVARAGQKKDFPRGIPACGSDALRLTLCSQNIKNTDINFDVSHAESRKKFCNKIWQSFRYVLSKLGSDFKPLQAFKLSGHEDRTDLWVLSRLSGVVYACDLHFKSYDLHLVTSSLQQFWHHEFCDVYLEAIKPVFSTQAPNKQHQDAVSQILYVCTDTFLRAAAPFMPFLCEELYQCLRQHQAGRSTSSVCVAPYPQPEDYDWNSEELETSMETVRLVAQHALRQRLDYNIMGSKSKVHVQSSCEEVMSSISEHTTCLLALSRSGGLNLLSTNQPSPPRCSSSAVDSHTTVFVELTGGALDVNQELERLGRRQEKLQTAQANLEGQLNKLEAKGKGQLPRAHSLRDKLKNVNEEQTRILDKVQTLTQANSS